MKRLRCLSSIFVMASAMMLVTSLSEGVAVESGQVRLLNDLPEEMEKESILKRYEKHSYLGMKRYLKKQHIPPDRVDECLGKYELKKLADEHAIELPDDVKHYK